MLDPRFTVHSQTVQSLPSSFPAPKKKLSHTVKAVPSIYKRRTTPAPTGQLQPLATRIPIPGIVRREGTRILRVVDPDRKSAR